MTSGKGVEDLINTLIKKKFNKKGFLIMAKISSWHFRHLLYVIWLKKACKRGESRGPQETPGYAYVREGPKISRGVRGHAPLENLLNSL